MTAFHTECLTLLHHDLLKALVCGQKIPPSALKNLFINFNMLHLFVVSGVHVYFLESLLKRTTKNTILISLVLWIYGLVCNFSAPILRVLVERLLRYLEARFSFHIPCLQGLLLSFLFCLPIAIFKNEFVSLNLSFYFSLLLNSTFGGSNLFKSIVIFILAHPVFIYGLGLPSAYSVFLLSFSGYFIGFVLLPLSFLSLVSEAVQRFSIQLCWQLEKVLVYIDVFFNHPRSNVKLEHFNLNFVFFHSLLLVLILILGNVIWKRKTLFL